MKIAFYKCIPDLQLAVSISWDCPFWLCNILKETRNRNRLKVKSQASSYLHYNQHQNDLVCNNTVILTSRLIIILLLFILNIVWCVKTVFRHCLEGFRGRKYKVKIFAFVWQSSSQADLLDSNSVTSDTPKSPLPSSSSREILDVFNNRYVGSSF